MSGRSPSRAGHAVVTGAGKRLGAAFARALAADGWAVRLHCHASRAEAEALAAMLDYAAAVDRFRAAQDLVRKRIAAGQPVDHIEASIIDTRLREVQLLLKEQTLQH